MINKAFSSLVRNYFGYLISEYGYFFREELYSEDPFGDALVEFYSTKTIITVRLDRLDIILLIGPFGERESSRLSLEVLLDFLANSDQHLPVTSFDSHESIEERIRFQLDKYAYMLQKYCDSILRGDFSKWLDVLRFYIKKMQNDYRLLTGLELPADAYKSIDEYINLKEAR